LKPLLLRLPLRLLLTLRHLLLTHLPLLLLHLLLKPPASNSSSDESKKPPLGGFFHGRFKIKWVMAIKR
jgi:hypothetical protein